MKTIFLQEQNYISSFKKIFKNIDFNFKTIEKRLRELAFLNTGVNIILKDKRSSEEKRIKF